MTVAAASAAAAVTASVCSPRAAQSAGASCRTLPRLSGRGNLGGQKAGQQALELAPEVGEVCSSGARFEVGDEIGRRQRCTLGPAAVDLPRPALETMAGDRVANLAAGGLAETGSPFGVAQAVEDKKRAAFAPTLGVTAAVIVRPAKGLTTPESLATPGRGLRFLRILRDACTKAVRR